MSQSQKYDKNYYIALQLQCVYRKTLHSEMEIVNVNPLIYTGMLWLGMYHNTTHKRQFMRFGTQFVTSIC